MRAADPDEFARLADIDEQAEILFREAGRTLPELPLSLDALRASRAVLVVGRPAVGFVQVGEVDASAHVHEIAVLPAHMRRGIGAALLAAACRWAADAGYPAITLTTYTDLDWNAPFYAARGFTALQELTPGLARIRREEADVGLDAAGPRVAMRRVLRGGWEAGPPAG